MTELFIYDASEVNKKKYIPFEKDPVMLGFREALRQLNPPLPFLIRGLLEDFYENNNSNRQGKNTFRRGESVGSLLKRVLKNGSDKDDDKTRFWAISREQANYIRDLGLKSCDIIDAFKYKEIETAHPYRTSNDGDLIPQGLVNDFSMVFDARMYTPLFQLDFEFYQQDIEFRRKALLGIIISDTNPNRLILQPMRFALTPENLEQVLTEIERTGYFQPPI